MADQVIRRTSRKPEAYLMDEGFVHLEDMV